MILALLVGGTLLALERVSRERANGLRETQAALAWMKSVERLGSPAAAAEELLRELHCDGANWWGLDLVERHVGVHLIDDLGGRDDDEYRLTLLEEAVARDVAVYDPHCAWGTFLDPVLRRGGGLVAHATGEALAFNILRQGFTQGVPYDEYERLPYTQGGDLHEGKGFNFASRLDRIPRNRFHRAELKYGDSVVVVQAPYWIEAYHCGDEEDQIILDAEAATPVAVVTEWTIYGRMGDLPNPAETLAEGALWVGSNYRSYSKFLSGKGRKP